MVRPNREDPILQRPSVQKAAQQIRDNLEYFIKQVPMSITEIRSRMEMDDSTFSRFRRGKNGYTKLEYLVAFAEAVGIDYTALINHHRREAELTRVRTDLDLSKLPDETPFAEDAVGGHDWQERILRLERELVKERKWRQQLEEENETLKELNRRYLGEGRP